MHTQSAHALYFKKPTIDDKDKIVHFRRAFNAVFTEMPGSDELNSFSDSGLTGWLTYINAPAGTQWFGYPKVTASTYIALLDDTMVGIVSLRHSLNDMLLQYGGHIGYSTHPDYQEQGIATAMLAFATEQLHALGIHPILVTCDVNNTASSKVIEKNGGILENIVNVGNSGVQRKRYWIDNNTPSQS